MFRIIVLTSLFVSASLAQAQEYGAVVGVHQTTAKATDSAVSTESKLNFKAGLAMAYELIPGGRFKTGAIYNQRHFVMKSAGVETKIQFDYIDVPATFQYNINEMIGFYGGLVIGINVNNRVEVPAGTAFTKPSVEGLYALGTVGANFIFDDMVGFDLYFERGLGKAASSVKDYSTIGGNFIYWF
jgi:hypothetical protein